MKMIKSPPRRSLGPIKEVDTLTFTAMADQRTRAEIRRL
jgi:hypothetical protein